jgi:hypothetical protein
MSRLALASPHRLASEAGAEAEGALVVTRD